MKGSQVRDHAVGVGSLGSCPGVGSLRSCPIAVIVGPQIVERGKAVLEGYWDLGGQCGSAAVSGQELADCLLRNCRRAAALDPRKTYPSI